MTTDYIYYSSMLYIVFGIVVLVAIKLYADRSIVSRKVVVHINTNPTLPKLVRISSSDLKQIEKYCKLGQNSALAVKHLAITAEHFNKTLCQNYSLTGLQDAEQHLNLHRYNHILLDSDMQQQQITSRLIYDAMLINGTYILPSLRTADKLLEVNSAVCLDQLSSEQIGQLKRSNKPSTLFIPVQAADRFARFCKSYSRWNGVLLSAYFTGGMKVVTY